MPSESMNIKCHRKQVTVLVLGRAGLCLLVLHLRRMLRCCGTRTNGAFLPETGVVSDFPHADLGFAGDLSVSVLGGAERRTARRPPEGSMEQGSGLAQTSAAPPGLRATRFSSQFLLPPLSTDVVGLGGPEGS